MQLCIWSKPFVMYFMYVAIKYSKLNLKIDISLPSNIFYCYLLLSSLSLWQLRAQIYPALKYALCVDICGTRWRTRPAALFTRWNMFGARWCTSAVTKAEIRPRAPQLWHKLGAKKYCWRDLAVFQRRFEKTLTKRLFQVVEYEGSNHIKNPEMQRVLLTHEVICR